MPEQPSKLLCPRCGEAVSGRFCVGCGAAASGVVCATCGASIPLGARFCSDCGAPIGAGARVPLAATRRIDRLPWLVGGTALLVLVAFVAGVATGRRSEPDVELPATPLANSGVIAAPDISAMSPEERASRLFNRVMQYSEQGKLDSARFFAPMAIQAYEMIGPVDAHARYDIGVISAAAGDVVRARAEADTILAERPNHLLGLVLAIRAADLTHDTAAELRFRRRLVAAAPTERTALKEYAEHSRDIDDALAKASAAR